MEEEEESSPPSSSSSESKNIGGDDVLQIQKAPRRKTGKQTIENIFQLGNFSLVLDLSKSVEEVQSESFVCEDFAEDEDRCCPQGRRSSQASDYFKKPSNVDISPPPESSETVLNRQQEYWKYFEKIKLTEEQANCLTIILQIATLEMLILSNCNRELLENMALDARKDLAKPSGKDGDSSINNKALKLAKMESDKLYMTDIIIKIYLDMRVNKSFPCLLVHLSDLSARSYQNMARNLHYKELKSTLRKLEAKLLKDTEKHKNKLVQVDKEIYKLMDDIDDSNWNSDIRTRYVDAWQNAQSEQHTLAIEKTAGGPLGTINHTKDLVEKENRIHKEIISFFKCTMEDCNEQIEKWMERFDKEIDQLDMDIRVLKEKKAEQTDETNALQNLMDEHKQQMDEWQAVLDERERLRALQELMLKSAIRIQAWWRGILARKLFRKLLKKKKRGKKGKKK